MEVLNTDAEGRLVLADGLILAAEGPADLIVDIATLTGAQRIALGDRVGAAFATEQEDVERVVAAGALVGERFWPMPLVDDYDHLIRSEVADVKNTGGRYGGTITAALILRPFAGGKRWVHLDIRGTGAGRCRLRLVSQRRNRFRNQNADRSGRTDGEGRLRSRREAPQGQPRWCSLKSFTSALVVGPQVRIATGC